MYEIILLQVQYTGDGTAEGTEGDAMVRELQCSKEAVDDQLKRSRMQLFNRGGLMRLDDAGTDEDDEDEDEEGEDEDMDGEDDDGEDEDEDEGDEEDSDAEEDSGERQAGAVCALSFSSSLHHCAISACAAEGVALPRGMPRGVAVDKGGRVRRQALFDGDDVQVEAGSEDEEEEEGEGEESQEGVDDDGDEEEEGEEEEEEEEEEEGRQQTSFVS